MIGKPENKQKFCLKIKRAQKSDLAGRSETCF